MNALLDFEPALEYFQFPFILDITKILKNSQQTPKPAAQLPSEEPPAVEHSLDVRHVPETTENAQSLTQG